MNQAGSLFASLSGYARHLHRDAFALRSLSCIGGKHHLIQMNAIASSLIISLLYSALQESHSLASSNALGPTKQI